MRNKFSNSSAHYMPFGATVREDSVLFRLFAPACEKVMLELVGLSEPFPMEADGSGWHEFSTPAASPGSEYRYVLPDATSVPDPASRCQPKDVHGPSLVIDPREYVWRDRKWAGQAWNEAVLYELHVGTFTHEGTFDAAKEKLNYLAELGITAIELMCVSDFAGNRNWGYDGVLPYAPDSAYGTPNAMKSFIDQAHLLGLSVILDVVYNHFGPEGNFIARYFPEISSQSYDTPWGKSLNFDGLHSDVVREFILHNALYWIEEFHLDGLRLDAAHAMVDESARHILDELHDRVTSVSWGRPVHLILENEQNIACRLRRDETGHILGYSAQWNHDITHLLGAAYSNLCDGNDQGNTERLTLALGDGFVIAAHERGAAEDCTLPPTAYIAFLQTHDLVGNRIFGDRVSARASSGVLRALSSIYLLLPQIPMIFMGEEWAASTPFPFFCDYHGPLADLVREGRANELKKLVPAPSEEEQKRAPDPQAESTFRSAQLRWDEINQPEHVACLDWYKHLLRTRRERITPLLGKLSKSCCTARVISPGAFTMRWKLGSSQLTLSANLCEKAHDGFPAAQGRVVWITGSCSDDGHFDPWSVRWELTETNKG